jgi:hypothetical protein
MTPHSPGCHRGAWLLRLPRTSLAGLFRAVLLEGPPCTCGGDCKAAEQSPACNGRGC